VDLDLTLGDSPFDKSALARKCEVDLFGRKIWIASAEDLLIYKLVSWRDRDVVDVHAIVKRQKNLDAAYLRKWIAWWEKEGIEGLSRRYEKLAIGT
jgi:LPS sulfotransferase NodH